MLTKSRTLKCCLLIAVLLVLLVLAAGSGEASAGNTLNYRFKGHYNADDWTRSVAVEGDYAYMANGVNGLIIVDVSNKTDPQKVGHYNTANGTYGVAVAGDYVYMADSWGGLVIVNISNKTDPQKAGHCNTGDHAYDIAVAGDYAYVANSWSGLVIVDISNKTDPQKVGHYDTADKAWGVAVAGDYAHVADRYNGLVIVDVSNKSNPQEAGHYDTADQALGVTVVDDYVYVADYRNGLVILELAPVAWLDSISPSPALDTDTIHLEGHGTDDGTIERYQWRSDRDGIFGNEVKFCCSNLSIGTHTITFKVQDNYGVWSEETTATLIVNEYIPPNKLPTVTITSPTNGATLKGTVIIKGTASDEDGTVETVDILVDGEWFQATGTTTWEYELDTTELENWDYVIKVLAFDGTDYSKDALLNITVNNEKDDDDDGGFLPGFEIVAVVGAVVGVAGLRGRKKT